MKITFLRGKTFFSLTVVFALCFIAWGDLILPKPLNQYSRNTRHKLEQVLIGIFPNIDAQSTRPSKKREKAVQQFQKEAAPSSNQN